MMGLPGSRGPMGSKVSEGCRWTFPGLLTKTEEQELSTKMGRAGLGNCYPELGSQSFRRHHTLGCPDMGFLFLLIFLALRVLPLVWAFRG